MIYLTLFILILNLLILNLLVLDFIDILNNIDHNIYKINIFIKNNHIKDSSIKHDTLSNDILSNNKECKLQCYLEIKKIIKYYDNISQFKYVYHMIPVKIQTIENNQCLIVYFNQPLINNKYNITNMNKDKRIFSMNYFNDNLCDWYITDMSISLWEKK
jgi:hypothetical protein